MPQAIATMLDPADCGPAFIALPQDTQEIAFDYPEEFFEERIWAIPRPRADRDRVAEAASLLKSAKKPIIISGGGVRYSGAEEMVATFAAARGIPVVETIAGKGALTHYDPVHAGPIGVVGSTSANTLAAAADVVVAIGTRLQDFTTGSWTVFARDAKFISINAARWDATKHRALAVVGDALETIRELDGALGDWKADAACLQNAQALFKEWDALLYEHQRQTNAPVPTYAQVVDVVNKAAARTTTSSPRPAASRRGRQGMAGQESPTPSISNSASPAWATKSPPAGATPWRTRASPLPSSWWGDGSYMMMNSDIYSSVLTGHKMIVVVCDNGGFAVITGCRNSRAPPASTTC